MVMIGFVGVATFDEWATGATSILQSGLRVSPNRPINETLNWALHTLITLFARLREVRL
jgi:hypothetical protein